jgi:hypothetical protein
MNNKYHFNSSMPHGHGLILINPKDSNLIHIGIAITLKVQLSDKVDTTYQN